MPSIFLLPINSSYFNHDHTVNNNVFVGVIKIEPLPDFFPNLNQAIIFNPIHDLPLKLAKYFLCLT